jgi:hypothetical protein
MHQLSSLFLPSGKDLRKAGAVSKVLVLRQTQDENFGSYIWFLVAWLSVTGR